MLPFANTLCFISEKPHGGPDLEVRQWFPHLREKQGAVMTPLALVMAVMTPHLSEHSAACGCKKKHLV